MVYKSASNKDEVIAQTPISIDAETDDKKSIPSAKPTGSSEQQGLSGGTKERAFQQAPRNSKRIEKKRMFGLVQEQRPAFILPEDYEQRYPPDEFGQEMGPNARVWRVYLDEAEPNDRDMVEGWRDGIDVLLVFAGLFSAVVTTFVTQTSQKLDQDFGQISASLLTELIALQRSLAVGSSLNDVPHSEMNLSSPPRFSTSDAWVNGLWFTSLSLSLITALFAVLIKQWVQHYVSFISGTPQERARVHHFRYMGIQRWSVPAIIGVLPVLLYAALFLFIFGLVVFLQPLKPEIASVVGVIGGTALTLYDTANALPVFYPQCPYRTPLIEHVRSMIYYANFIIRRITFPLIYRLLPCLLVGRLRCALEYTFPSLKDWLGNVWDIEPPSYKAIALKSFEFKAAKDVQDEIVSEVVHWLLTYSANPSVKPIALQSLSGLRFGFTRIDLLVRGRFIPGKLEEELLSQHTAYYIGSESPELFIGSPLFYAIERTLRASMLIPHSVRVSIPITKHTFPTHLEAHGQDVALQQPLTTYTINYAPLAQDKSIARDVMPTLTDLYNTTSKNAMVWHAWFSYLEDSEDVFKCPNPSLAGVYNWLKPFFNVLLDWNCSSKIWEIALSFVGKALPPHLVERHHDLFKRSYPNAPTQEAMALSTVGKAFHK